LGGDGLPVGIAVSGHSVTKDVVVSCAHAEIGNDESSVHNLRTDKAVGKPPQSAGGGNLDRGGGHGRIVGGMKSEPDGPVIGHQ